MDRYSLLKTCFRKELYNLFHSKGQTASYVHSLTSPVKSPRTNRGNRVSKLQAGDYFLFPFHKFTFEIKRVAYSHLDRRLYLQIFQMQTR